MDEVNKAQKLALDFFESNLDKWLKDVAYKGKFVVINGQTLEAVFDQGSDAYKYAVENLVPGEFIIKEIVSKEDSIVYLPTVF